MATPSELEDRVASLEEEVARLKQKIDDPSAKENWVGRFSGKFKDNPSFDEIVELGAEIRQSQRPDTHG